MDPDYAENVACHLRPGTKEEKGAQPDEIRVFQLQGGNQSAEMTRTSAVTGAVEKISAPAHRWQGAVFVRIAKETAKETKAKWANLLTLSEEPTG